LAVLLAVQFVVVMKTSSALDICFQSVAILFTLEVRRRGPARRAVRLARGLRSQRDRRDRKKP
jgi:hypothetical protein